MIPRIFEGQPVILVAGGPSLKGFDFTQLSGRNHLAINRAYQDCPDANVLWWNDSRFWANHGHNLIAHRAPYKATCRVGYYSCHNLPKDIHQYTVAGNFGFDERPSCVMTGNNSAYTAMHALIHMGTSMIVLLGVDMKHGPNGETHYHGGHEVRHEEAILTDYMLPYFAGLAAPLVERGIPVLNASPESVLTVWPRCSITEGLAAFDTAMARAKEKQCAHASPSQASLTPTRSPRLSPA